MDLLEIFSPVIGTTAIIALCFLIGAPIYFLVERTEMGARFKDATPWLGWTDFAEEDNYTNFTIHRSNYIRVPSR